MNPTPIWPADADAIARAATMIHWGGLVAFPTETVYGLGANALSEHSVEKIFAAKGRPSTNPIIVHVASIEQVHQVASEWPEVAQKLAAAFWPGPLTLVLPKHSIVPDVVTAGGPTVAVRWPNHPVAIALISQAGVPIAAPSANRSTELSPTRAEHVFASLNGRIDAILDGGPCSGGIESTVVDVTDGVRILRPGSISAVELEAIIGLVKHGTLGTVAKSPGLMEKHYCPRTPLFLAESAEELELLRENFAELRTYVLQLGRTPLEAANRLYATLHELDSQGFDAIFVELPPNAPEWAGVRDRLLRARSERK